MAKSIYDVIVNNVQSRSNGVLLEKDSSNNNPSDFSYYNPSGFYYDEQLNNPLTRVTLHANRKYNGDVNAVDGPWEAVPNPDPEDSEMEYPYDVTPIATSIFAEDFTFDIANTFSDFGGDPIGEMWNSQMAMAPYSGLVADALKTISAKTEEWNEQRSGGRVKWADALAKVTDFIAKGADKNEKLRARALHFNGTQFSYYSGSKINFNNMSMKFTLLSDWEDGVFKSVIDKLTDGTWPLLAYIIGDYVAVKDIVSEKDSKDVHDFLSDYASWQLPPGGFRANLKDVDVINEGTLKLRFGPYFSIPNLVVTGCSMSMSKEMLRVPNLSATHKIVPMACDVVLQFKPAANFSKKTLTAVLGGGQQKYLDSIVTSKKFSSVQQK